MKTESQFLGRASSIGKLMTNDRSGKNIGETAIKELQQMVLFDKYGIVKDISSKYTDKGIQNERIGMEMAMNVLGWFDLDIDAPKIRHTNQFITGEPDIFTPNLLADIKCSFDGTTFPWFDDECPNKMYMYQMQSYMWLTGRDESFLVYVLTDMPEQMILDEIGRATWRNLPNPKYADKTQTEIEELMDEHVRSQWTFGHIPMEQRVKSFRIERDENTIEAIKTRIEICRGLYNKFWNQI